MKVIGYVVALVGLLLLVVSSGGFGFTLPFDSTIVITVAAGAVGVGVILIVLESRKGSTGSGTSGHYQGTRKSKSKGKVADLPVYEGDNIIAYRRD